MGSISNVEELDSYLGCCVSSLPIGSAFGSSIQGQAHWDSFLDKMQKIQAGRKKIHLSKGGRLTLIKSMLSSLPTYLPSVFPMPAGVAKRLENSKGILFLVWGGGGGGVQVTSSNFIQSIIKVSTPRLAIVGQVQRTCFFLIQFCWESGCGSTRGNIMRCGVRRQM